MHSCAHPRATIRTRNWFAFSPTSEMLSIVAFSLLLLQSSLDEVFNPRLRTGRARRAKKAVADVVPAEGPPK